MCCEVIAVYSPWPLAGWPRLIRGIARLGELIYPFRFNSIQGQHFLYTCENFDAASRTCLNYRFRPRVCREYPAVSHFGRPQFYKGCGFSVRLRGRPGSFVEVLDRRRKQAPPPGPVQRGRPPGSPSSRTSDERHSDGPWHRQGEFRRLDGQLPWSGQGGAVIDSVSPVDGQTLGSVRMASLEDYEA